MSAVDLRSIVIRLHPFALVAAVPLPPAKPHPRNTTIVMVSRGVKDRRHSPAKAREIKPLRRLISDLWPLAAEGGAPADLLALASAVALSDPTKAVGA